MTMRPGMDMDCRSKSRIRSRFVRILTMASLVLALPGCGGGGSSSAPKNDTGVTMSVSPLTLSVSATTTQPAPAPGFRVDFSGLGAIRLVFVGAQPGGQGINHILNSGGRLPATLVVELDSPVSLGPGTYTGTVQVQGCLDQGCTQPVGDSPQTVQVQYTVTASTFSTTGLSPSSDYAGAQSFTLTVTGTTYTSQSKVLWNGAPLATTFVSSTRLTAQVPAADFTTAGNAEVSVSDPVNGTTDPKPFIIKPSPITVTSLAPGAAIVGKPAFTLTVTGSGFTSRSGVLWNGSPQTTTFVSATKLTAQIPATEIAATGSELVSVNDPTFGTSSSQTFTVEPTPLAIASISPTAVTVGGPAFTLTVLGTKFSGTSVVEWDGIELTTTLVSSTELTAQVPASDINATGTASVLVSDPNVPPNTTGTQILTIASPSKDAVSYQINAAHDGAVTFANVNLPFPTTPAWSVDVGGTPSYALIADSVVVVTVQLTTSAKVVALDQATGTTVWTIPLSGSAVATYDAGRVFVVSGVRGAGTTLLQAYDISDGTLEWSKTLTGEITFTALPAAADGKVYVAPVGILVALAESDGTILWSENQGSNSISPTVTVDGVYTTSCVTDDLRPATGESVWEFNAGCSGGLGGIPILANQLDYASGTIFDAETGANDGSYTANSAPAFSATMGYFLQSGTLNGITLSNNAVKWSFTGDGNLSGAPIAVNQYVFIGSSSGNVYAVDSTTTSATPTPVWNVNLGTAIDTNNVTFVEGYSGLAAGDGLLVVPAGTKVTAYTLSTNP